MSNVTFAPSQRSSERLIGFLFHVLQFIEEEGIPKLQVSGQITIKGRSIRAIGFYAGYGATRLDVSRICNDGVATSSEADRRTYEFRGVLNVFGLGATFSLVVAALEQSGGQSGEAVIWLGEITGQQQPLSETPLVSGLTPICVTCLGRSGSTLLMRILSAHPDILVAGGYPHETKYAQKVLYSTGGSLDAMLSEAETNFGAVEAYRRFRNEAKRDLLGSTVSVIDRFYRCHAQTQEKPAVRYFAEKCLPSFLPNVARDIYGPRAKEIILVRDPRDIFCSAMSFNNKRGFMSFGAEYNETDAEWFRFLRNSFLQIADANDRRPEALAIRYEDLILDQRKTIVKILRFLDVLDTDGAVDAIEARIFPVEAAFVEHMTSATPVASIARWRAHEVPGIFKEENNKYLKAMETFGYS